MIYTFKNHDTGEEIEVSMSVSELDKFKEDNPHLSQLIKPTGIIGGVSMDSGRLPDSWKDKLRDIKQRHPRGGGVDHLI